MKKGSFLVGLCLLFVALPWALRPLPMAMGADAELEAAIQKRLVRLKRIAAARDELVAERSKHNSQYETLNKELAQTQAQMAANNQQASLLSVENVRLQREQTSLNTQARAVARGGASATQARLVENQLQDVRTRLNATNLGMTQLSAAINLGTRRAQAIEVQGAGLRRAMQAVSMKLDAQHRDFVDVADPFGRLSRAEHEAALPLFNDWITADAENWGARLARAFAYRKLGQLEETLAELTSIIESRGSLSALAFAARGELQMARGKEKNAMADFGQAFKLDKKDPRFYVFRGLANCCDGKFQAAEDDFKSALRLNKDDVEAARLAALLGAACEFSGIRDARKSLQLAERASELTKFGDWACLDALAAAHAESGDYDEAARTAREAAELTFGENREQCYERMKLYEARTPLRIKWK